MVEISMWEWGAFFAFVFGMLALDLGVFHKKQHAVGLKEAAIWSVVWVLVSLGLNGLIYWHHGPDKAVDFFTCYVIEKSLSVDNLFVFLAIFTFFGVKGQYQHRVLFWGIIGAFLIRGVFIAGGTALLSLFDWILMPIFGGFLAYKGCIMWGQEDGDEEKDFADNAVIRWFKRNFRVTDKDHGPKFFAREDVDGTGVLKRVATPLFIVLLIVEMTDVIFAVDSIPAIIGISRDPFILITSNVMAILGLRAMYFVLAAVNKMFCYLQKGMCLILMFVGFKMVLPYAVALISWIAEKAGTHWDLHAYSHIDKFWSLGIIMTLLFGSCLLSVIWPAKEEEEDGGGKVEHKK